MSLRALSIQDFKDARERVSKVIRETPFARSDYFSQVADCDVYLKFENTQRTGSFKIRGAYNKISRLSDAERARGVVASSAGNHAQGVALSAHLLTTNATIVMPTAAPLTKVESTKRYGAEVVLHGDFYDDAYQKAREIEAQSGAVFIPPYEDSDVVAGQGTIGLEIYESMPDLDSIIVPIGGGGLMSGIAGALKQLNPKIKVYGVQSERANSMERLFHHQTNDIHRAMFSTIADGIAIKKPSQAMLDHYLSKYVDDIVLVSDDEIAEAITLLMTKQKTVCEGAGAAGIAALLNGKMDLGQKTCVVLCGGNIDLNLVAKIIERGQIKRGKLVEFSVVVDDLPGRLSKLTQILADLGANVLEVHHDRVDRGLGLRETRIDFVIETIDADHALRIRQAIKDLGVRILQENE